MRGIANAAGVHGDIDDPLLDLRRLPGIGIVQQKRTTASLPALSAAIALIAFGRLVMADNISALTTGTM
jgi:hypothetical protein